MTALWSLTRSGFTEARRNRVTVVLAAFAIVLILMTAAVLNTTVFTLDRVVTDFGLGVMSLLLVGLSLFLSVGMLSREIDRRTVFLTVSRPVSRTVFVLGRYLGMVLTLTVMLLVMTATYGLQLLLFQVAPTGGIVAAICGLWLELVVLLALGLFFSAFTGQLVAAVNVTALYLIGHWAPDLYALAHNTKTAPALRWLAAIAYYVVPNLDRFDFKPEAAYATPVEPIRLITATFYALGWALLLVSAAAALFRRRDFK